MLGCNSHVLHLAAWQEHCIGITADDRPKLTIIDAYSSESDDCLLCSFMDHPHMVQILLEYGADREVVGYDAMTPLQRAESRLAGRK